MWPLNFDGTEGKPEFYTFYSIVKGQTSYKLPTSSKEVTRPERVVVKKTYTSDGIVRALAQKNLIETPPGFEDEEDLLSDSTDPFGKRN